MGTTIRGAGAWYSVLRSNNPFNNGGVSGGIELRDFAVMGAVTERNDKLAGQRIPRRDQRLRIENNRILNTMADGVNFDGAVTDSVMNDNYPRNTGDDVLATWSNGTPNAR